MTKCSAVPSESWAKPEACRPPEDPFSDHKTDQPKKYMNDALQIAATGMQAQQLQVDTIAHNLANVNTLGFKKSRVDFHDLVTRMADQSMARQAGRPLDAATQAGLGVAVAGLSRQFEAGELRKTESNFDLAIQGEGLIELQLPDGTRAFSRGGTIKRNAEGLLALNSGQVLAGAIYVPEGAQDLTFDTDGRVLARLQGQSRQSELGQITLVRFQSPGELAVLGDGVYRATERSGDPVAAQPGDEQIGALRQGHLEASNVRMVDEMVGLMVAQRAYEASVNVAKAADEMLGMANNLRK